MRSDFSERIQRPRSHSYECSLRVTTQFRRLVSIFEMVPPVQKMTDISQLIYLYPIQLSIYSSIPWTEGNPKRIFNRITSREHSSIPWTEGNPKPIKGMGKFERDSSIPWTEGNPKLKRSFCIGKVNSSIPWTEGNPKH